MSKFKIGDQVEVTARKRDWEFWVNSMDEYVGEIGEVTGFEDMADTDIYARVTFENENGYNESYFFPDDALDYLGGSQEPLNNVMSVFDLVRAPHDRK